MKSSYLVIYCTKCPAMFCKFLICDGWSTAESVSKSQQSQLAIFALCDSSTISRVCCSVSLPFQVQTHSFKHFGIVHKDLLALLGTSFIDRLVWGISSIRPLSKSVRGKAWWTQRRLSKFISKKILQQATYILQFKCDYAILKTQCSFIPKRHTTGT